MSKERWAFNMVSKDLEEDAFINKEESKMDSLFSSDPDSSASKFPPPCAMLIILTRYPVFQRQTWRILVLQELSRTYKKKLSDLTPSLSEKAT